MNFRFLCFLALFSVRFLAPEPIHAAENSATFVTPKTVDELRALLTKEFNKKHRNEPFSEEAIQYWQGILHSHKQQNKESRYPELKTLREEREKMPKVFTYIPRREESAKSVKRLRKSSLGVSFSEGVKIFDGLSKETSSFIEYFKVYDVALNMLNHELVAEYLGHISLEEKKWILPGLESLVEKLEALIEARKTSDDLEDSVPAWTKGGFDFRVKVEEFDILKTKHLRLLKAVIRIEESRSSGLGPERT